MTAVLGAIGGSAALGFVLLVLVLRAGGARRADTAILAAIQKRWGPRDTRGSHKAQTAMRDLTALGGDMVTGLFAASAVAVLLVAGRGEDALRYVLIVAAARIAGLLVKKLARRERPPHDGTHVKTFTSSFPSVHTLMSFANGFAVAHVVIGGGAFPLAALGVAAALSALVGWTRLYFAVHWPSDVLAGWLAGCALCAGAGIIFTA